MGERHRESRRGQHASAAHHEQPEQQEKDAEPAHGAAVGRSNFQQEPDRAHGRAYHAGATQHRAQPARGVDRLRMERGRR